MRGTQGWGGGLLVLLLMVPGSARATDVAQDVPFGRAEELTAGYLFNFVKFIEWPAGWPAGGVLHLCFRGGDGVLGAMRARAGREGLADKRVVLRKVAESEGLGECSVVYIESDGDVIGIERRGEGERAPLLTVSDSRGFVRRGGMIELYMERKRLRFSINVDNVRGAGLRVSSDLLQLASHIERGS